ncbi:lipoyl(octanoyl) transferase LipB [Bacillus horti]|uniref:Octanoyltransferase n=1 Tax=Caldalkalibacillus horti TaxID=77523 RepID=A0ABT9W186_9BACI|nr:lipoyl(octanoyl) transferase LipB [Bacillus horti]MDQ0166849.1 lipoyl(octanoyl) transferase [Bacillus horti]
MEWKDDLLEIHHFNMQQKYQPMWDTQIKWVQEIDQKQRFPSLLLLEHQHVYTLGRGSHLEHLLITKEQCLEKGIDLVEIDRGGDITYHGPGQLVGYPLILLQSSGNDAHLYLRNLEESIIRTLADFGIEAGRKESYTGVWVKDEKVAAIGVKFNRGRQTKSFITSHGFALNVSTNLDMFEYIIPCGIREYGVTSLEKILGTKVDILEVSRIYSKHFLDVFSLTNKDISLV